MTSVEREAKEGGGGGGEEGTKGNATRLTFCHLRLCSQGERGEREGSHGPGEGKDRERKEERGRRREEGEKRERVEYFLRDGNRSLMRALCAKVDV